MNEQQFRVLLNLLMVSDPWPLSVEEQRIIEEYAEAKSKELGYPDWIEAYHRIPQL